MGNKQKATRIESKLKSNYGAFKQSPCFFSASSYAIINQLGWNEHNWVRSSQIEGEQVDRRASL
jgi:hypothetical protein